MIRALYTATSGMRVQQHEIDNVGNNIANALTVGYKKSRTTFKDTLYDVMEIRTKEPDVNLQVGNGVKVGGNRTSFKPGILELTHMPLDMAINGEGFFTVGSMEDGQPLYTKNGSFRLARLSNNRLQLETREGNPVLNDRGGAIQFYGDINEDEIIINEDGRIYINNQTGQSEYHARLGIGIFQNPNGLQRAGASYFYATEESGPAIEGQAGDVLQGYLEISNVEMSEEMTRLIMAQRAYQLNSRVLQTADEMERLANNLRG